jgi:hypothetical protein
MARKKPAPDDTALIPSADHFDVTVFLGRGKFRTETLPTLAAARERGPQLAAEAGRGRPALIYAITAEGRSALVPDGYEPNQAPEPIPAAFTAALGPKARRGTADAAGKAEPAPAAIAPPKSPSKREAALLAAHAGTLPPPPNFEAPTHKRFRPKLAQVVALAEAGDIAGLKAMTINPVSSSPKAIAKYRDLCVIALEARASAA